MTTQFPSGLPKVVKNKVALITGASSGIGLTVAHQLAAAGAHVLLVARTKEKLDEVKAEIEQAGGKASVFPCDLNSMESIDECAQQILAEVGHIDILINNAGRSIRRAVNESIDRFHDFERTMQLNYFGAIRLILGVLPHMINRKSGHIINISSIGVLANAPRFSAYVASKAALDAFSRCLSAEVRAHKIHFTSNYMPLVRTPMIAPTTIYKYVPTLTPQQAGNLVAEALIKRPKSIATAVGTFAAVSYALAPKFNDFVLSVGYRLFPSSTAAKGKRAEAVQKTGKLNLKQKLFVRLFPGEHW